MLTDRFVTRVYTVTEFHGSKEAMVKHLEYKIEEVKKCFPNWTIGEIERNITETSAQGIINLSKE